MRDLLERLKLERKIALALFVVTLLSIAALHFLTPFASTTNSDEFKRTATVGAPE